MFKLEELLPRETWTFVLSKLSTTDELSCRCVCVSFKNDVDSILKNQDRLWLRHSYDDYEHYFCYDKDHRISSRDTLDFGKTISVKKLKFVSKLMPSLKILQLDPLYQAYLEGYNEYSDHIEWDERFPDYRDEKGRAVPITKIFPQVACLILPGETETDNFVGDLSQVKHLTILYGVQEESPTFVNLDSLEVRIWSSAYGDRFIPWTTLPMPSKRFVVPDTTIEWATLPKTLEVIETGLNCEGYTSTGKPHFSNFKILKGLHVGRSGQNLETLMNFLTDHKGSLTELSFSVGEHVDNIKVLLPLLTQLQKLSVTIETNKQAIEFKEIKALAHDLQYFELSFCLWSSTEKNLGAILENLPKGLDNLSIKNIGSYGDIDTVMEKIMEKVVNGDTKRVTIAKVNDKFEDPEDIIKEIIDMKPEAVRVKQTATIIFEYRSDSPGSRTDHFGSMCDIVISL